MDGAEAMHQVDDLPPYSERHSHGNDAHWNLLYFVGSILVVFYVIIFWVLRDSDKDRRDQLNRSKLH